MKIAVLGLGMWGFSLARHLALNGYNVVGWTIDTRVFDLLKKGKDHPFLLRSSRGLPITYTDSLEEAISEADLIVESVTTKGLREVLSSIKSSSAPLVLTSKGIEQKTFLSTPEIALDVFGEEAKNRIALISGPSFASEVAKQLPVAVVCGAWEKQLCENVIRIFSSKTFRVYPNLDIQGVALGGALKNVIAIACGIADGLHLGLGARSALVTRGLHEIVKLAVSFGCSSHTLYGLSGLGDLYLTTSSSESRNFRFGQLLSSGLTLQEARKQVGMVVEGAYTCVAAKELAEKYSVAMPITNVIFGILHEKISIEESVDLLMLRSIKEEHL